MKISQNVPVTNKLSILIILSYVSFVCFGSVIESIRETVINAIIHTVAIKNTLNIFC